MKYYVVGEADTRGEFYPKGVSKSLLKAEKHKAKLQEDLYLNSRQWITIKQVNSID
tara:strand:+ start:221 stop:388 length:168 start_codon:yes stop_codon:yes gene_type:complete